MERHSSNKPFHSGEANKFMPFQRIEPYQHYDYVNEFSYLL